MLMYTVPPGNDPSSDRLDKAEDILCMMHTFQIATLVGESPNTPTAG